MVVGLNGLNGPCAQNRVETEVSTEVEVVMNQVPWEMDCRAVNMLKKSDFAIMVHANVSLSHK